MSECLKAFYTSQRCDHQLSRSLTGLIDRKCKQLITQFCQTMQTILINKVSMEHQNSEKSEASIWFSLYERATINIIGGNLNLCALTVAPLLCLHVMWVYFCQELLLSLVLNCKDNNVRQNLESYISFWAVRGQT